MSRLAASDSESCSSSSESEIPRFKDAILSQESEANICDVKGLKRRLKDISYPIPEKATRVPWLERLDIVAEEGLEDIAADNVVQRENAFFDLALKTTRLGLKKLKYLGIKYTRPTDYFVEMVKDDEHMRKVHSRLSSQELRMQAVEKRKEKVWNRKFAKKLKAAAKSNKEKMSKAPLLEEKEKAAAK